MGVDHHCRWVRHRLPLLAGGELGIDERRKVERHLIGCLGCRDRREAATGALSALRSVAEVAPVAVDSPSLWPALSAQIRQSRHASSRSSWWEMPLPRAWAALSLAMGLIGVVATPLSLLSGRVPTPPSATEVQAATAGFEDVEQPELPSLTSTQPGALPSGRSIADNDPLRNSGKLNFDPNSTRSTQFNYDLDHGTPMGGPGGRDPQRSY